MKPNRPVIICRASSTWVVADASAEAPSGLQFWMAQMPVSATAVRNPNLMPGLLVMRCTASTMGLCNTDDRLCQHIRRCGMRCAKTLLKILQYLDYVLCAAARCQLAEKIGGIMATFRVCPTRLLSARSWTQTKLQLLQD